MMCCLKTTSCFANNTLLMRVEHCPARSKGPCGLKLTAGVYMGVRTVSLQMAPSVHSSPSSVVKPFLNAHWPGSPPAMHTHYESFRAILSHAVSPGSAPLGISGRCRTSQDPTFLRRDLNPRGTPFPPLANPTSRRVHRLSDHRGSDNATKHLLKGTDPASPRGRSTLCQNGGHWNSARRSDPERLHASLVAIPTKPPASHRIVTSCSCRRRRRRTSGTPSSLTRRRASGLVVASTPGRRLVERLLELISGVYLGGLWKGTPLIRAIYLSVCTSVGVVVLPLEPGVVLYKARVPRGGM